MNEMEDQYNRIVSDAPDLLDACTRLQEQCRLKDIEIARLNYFLGQNSARISGLEKLMIRPVYVRPTGRPVCERRTGREESITNDKNIKY